MQQLLRESAQIDKLREWRELYGLSTKNVGLKSLVPAVELLYSAAGQPPPAMLWCDGPLQAVFINALLPKMRTTPIGDYIKLYEDHEEGDPGDIALSDFTHKFIVPMFEQRSIEGWSQKEIIWFVDRLFNALLDPQRSIPGNIEMEPEKGAWSASAVADRYDRITFKSLQRTPDPRFPLSDNLMRELSTERRRCINIRSLVSNAMERRADFGVMERNLRWLGFTDWLGIYWALGLPADDEPFCEETRAFITLAQHCSAVLFGDDVCFLVRKPTVVSVNERLRAHAEGGPFIKFQDGLEAYAINGVALPPEMRSKYKKMNGHDIMSIDNVEIRRALIEWYGLEKFVFETGGKLVHEDRYGQLFRKPMPLGEEAICIVKVKNSTPEPDGSYRYYFIRVPPFVRTAKEAVAWTFGVPAKDYAPQRET